MPAFRITNELELEREMAERTSEEAWASLERTTAGLSLFGLGPAALSREQVITSQVSHAGAFYRSTVPEIVVVDRGESMSDEGAMSLLAHEIVHAMQDAEQPLAQRFARGGGLFDNNLAVRALIEGEAMHYQLIFLSELSGNDAQLVDWYAYYRERQRADLIAAEADEQPLLMASQRFSYSFGANLVSEAWRGGGNPGVRALWDDPARTSQRILFGPELQEEQDTEHTALRAHALPVLPEGFEAVMATSLGAWITRIYAGRLGVPIDARFDAPRNMTSDVFSIHIDPIQSQVLASWRVRLRPEAPLSGWPGFWHPPINGVIVFDQHELYLVAQAPEMRFAPDALMWREFQSAEPGDAMQMTQALNGSLREDCTASVAIAREFMRSLRGEAP